MAARPRRLSDVSTTAETASPSRERCEVKLENVEVKTETQDSVLRLPSTRPRPTAAPRLLKVEGSPPQSPTFEARVHHTVKEEVVQQSSTSSTAPRVPPPPPPPPRTAAAKASPCAATQQLNVPPPPPAPQRLALPVEYSADPPADQEPGEDDAGEGAPKKRRTRRRAKKNADPKEAPEATEDLISADLKAIWRIHDPHGVFRDRLAEIRGELNANPAFTAFMRARLARDPSTNDFWYPEAAPLETKNFRARWVSEFRTFMWALKSWTEAHNLMASGCLDVKHFLQRASFATELSPAGVSQAPRQIRELPPDVEPERETILKAIRSTRLVKAFELENDGFASKYSIAFPPGDVHLLSTKQFKLQINLAWDAMVGWARGRGRRELFSELQIWGLKVAVPQRDNRGTHKGQHPDPAAEDED